LCAGKASPSPASVIAEMLSMTGVTRSPSSKKEKGKKEKKLSFLILK
jgi:hypothetical protein